MRLELTCLSKSLTLLLFPALLRSVPEGTDMFEVYGTPGVDIYVSPSMERNRERADTRRWCFNKGLEIIVVMNSPSNDLNDSHVSSPQVLLPIFLQKAIPPWGNTHPRARLLGVNPNSPTYRSWLYVLRPRCVNLKDGVIPVLFPGWMGMDPECLLFDQLP